MGMKIFQPLEKNILAIDSSEQIGSVAFSKKNEGISQILEEKADLTNSTLLELIHFFCKKHQIEPASIEGVITNIGPSSFTSLRISIATANGLAFASQIPTFGLPSLQALGMTLEPNVQGPISIIKNAYKGEVYYGVYQFEGELLKVQQEIQSISLASLREVVPAHTTLYCSSIHQKNSLLEALTPYSLVDLDQQEHSISYGMLRYFLNQSSVEEKDFPLKAYYVRKPEAVKNYENKFSTKLDQILNL